MTAIEKMLGIVECEGDRQLLLIVGFDGVLVDYSGDREAVGLSFERRALLKAFATYPDVALGIISGRVVSDLRRRAAVGEEVFYIGLHGLEVEGPSFRITQRHMLDDHRNRVHEIVTAVAPAMSSLAGVRLEDKDAAIAVHTREANSADAVWARVHLLSTAAGIVPRDALRVIRGSHVMELLPSVPNPRAAAIVDIRRRLEEQRQKPVFTVYIGEDVPDDDAFNAIGRHALSAVVGWRSARAQYHLATTGDAWKLIEALGLRLGSVSHAR